MDRLLALRKAHPEARLAAGHNEVGIEVKYGAPAPEMIITIMHVPKLAALKVRAC